MGGARGWHGGARLDCDRTGKSRWVGPALGAGYVAELWRDDDFALVFERVRGRAVIRANLDGA